MGCPDYILFAAISALTNELKRIPFLLIVGEKEEAEGKVSVRVQGEGDKGAMTIAEFAEHINSLVDAEIEANKMA